MAMYLLDSGLLNYHNDIVGLPKLHESFIAENGDINLESIDPNTKLVYHSNPKSYQDAIFNHPISSSVEFIRSKTLRQAQIERTMTLREGTGAKASNSLLYSNHIPYSKAVETNQIPEGTPCYSTIRNPVDRWLSLINITYGVEEIQSEGINDMSLRLIETMNTYRSSLTSEPAPPLLLLPEGINSFLFRYQSYYISENTTLWPLENLHEHITSFIESKGGRVRDKWWPRYNKTRDRDVQLSTEVEQKINEYFTSDVALWESVI